MAAPTRPAAKRAPKKAAAKPAAPPVVEADPDAELAALAAEADGPIAGDGSIRPVQIGKRGRTPNRLVTIFVLDGVDYQIPEKPSPALLIAFQRDLRKLGRDLAVQNLLVTLLGQEALDALSESPEVTEEDVADVFAIVAHLGFGAIVKQRAASDPS